MHRFELFIRDVVVATPPVMVTTWSEVGRHDLLEVTVDQPLHLPNATTGAPMSLRYGGREFNGYVHSVSTPPREDRDRPPTAKVTCVGATMVLKEPQQSVVSSSTVTRAVRQALRAYRLAGVVLDDDGTLRDYSHPGSSTWEFLVATAARAGMVIAPRDTSVLVCRPQALMRRQGNLAPVVRDHDSKTSIVTRTTQGPESGYVQRRGLAVTDDGAIVGASESPVAARMGPSPYTSKIVAPRSSTVTQFRDELAAMNTAEGNLPYEARITSQNLDVRALDPIYVESNDPHARGLWIAYRVENQHRSAITNTTITARRSFDKDLGFLPNRILPSREAVEYPPSRLRNTRWEAAWC